MKKMTALLCALLLALTSAALGETIPGLEDGVLRPD